VKLAQKSVIWAENLFLMLFMLLAGVFIALDASLFIAVSSNV
jgi:hypothetical protein